MLSRRKFLAFLATLPGLGWATRSGAATVGDDRVITHAKIHPAIGIARVGNSRDGFFLGPEAPAEPALPAGSYKDKKGALKRQAARFRIYGYNAAGEVVRELTADNATVTWHAHLANKKGAWYQFQLALDLPEAAQPGAALSRRRNPQIRGAARAQLVIDPGPRTITGKAVSGAAYQFDTGKFRNLPVPLGELRTDESGRLLVLGGFGLSRALNGQPTQEFANNDNWHDDIADGPVEAQVTLEGRALPVEGAWVVVGPPNYAPALKTVRTLHDLMFDCAVAWGFSKAPEKVSFTRHIAPIFRRLSGLQWVNHGFATVFGFGAEYDADKILPRLADAAEANRALRREIFEKFRNPKDGRLGKLLWPFLYGDAWDSLNNNEPDVTVRVERSMAPVSDLHLGWLKKWADGDFINDLATAPPAPKSLADFPLTEQPSALDEAALAFCVADAFHPGCEVTWPIRHRSLYIGHLRLRRRPPDQAEPDYGEILTPVTALAANGPLSASGPGDLTRWMAIPWQTDTASCLWAYDVFRTSESLPTFWPARVPNEVLAESDYRVAVDVTQPIARRQAAFATRRNWFRGLGDDPNQMVTNFHRVGLIEARPGATDAAQLPAQMFVESKPDLVLPEERPGARNAVGRAYRQIAERWRKAVGKINLG